MNTEQITYYNSLNISGNKAISVSIDEDKNINFIRNGHEHSFILFNEKMTPKEMMDWLFHFSEKWESPYVTAALVEAFRLLYGNAVYAR